MLIAAGAKDDARSPRRRSVDLPPLLPTNRDAGVMRQLIASGADDRRAQRTTTRRRAASRSRRAICAVVAGAAGGGCRRQFGRRAMASRCAIARRGSPTRAFCACCSAAALKLMLSMNGSSARRRTRPRPECLAVLFAARSRASIACDDHWRHAVSAGGDRHGQQDWRAADHTARGGRRSSTWHGQASSAPR
jgi:hypothetical protein